MDVTYAGALIAGVLSFLSPCVLPLVPPYLCFLGGTTFDQLAGEDETPSHVYATVVLSSVAGVRVRLVQRACHGVEGALQRAQLVVPVHRQLMGEILLRPPLRRAEVPLSRASQAAQNAGCGAPARLGYGHGWARVAGCDSGRRDGSWTPVA